MFPDGLKNFFIKRLIANINEDELRNVRLGENRTHFTLLCRDALQSRKVQEYQGFANEVLGLRYATYRPVTACSSG